MNCKEKKECICCGKEHLDTILDLQDQPLANSYHKNDSEQLFFPLKLNLCKNCYHLQLSHIVNPDLMFKDYLYVSGTTKTLREYFDWFADFSIEKYEQFYHEPNKVLDIACNDGSQLDAFKERGLSTFGIDPAENLYEISSKKHSVICDYFNANVINDKFDMIVAQNVFAHNENALTFLEDCKNIMNTDSLLFVQVSQADMIKENQFDTIYHEHISFFSINSFNVLVERAGLKLLDVVKTPIHGNSNIFIVGFVDWEWCQTKENRKNLILSERDEGLRSINTYRQYANRCKKIAKNFKVTIQEYRKDGYEIIGYGAAAKGNTFLNFANESLDYIIDDNPLKHDLYTPGKNIPIVGPDKINEFKNKDRILFVPLAWNFFEEIKGRILKRRRNNNDRFLTYFPKVKIL